MHQCVSTTNFFFSHSFFWKSSSWARKSMILPAMRRMTLILREVLLDARGGLVLDVVEVHHLVLDVEVQLAAQEGAEILVDEVVEGVARGVAVEVHAQPRVVGLGAVGADVLGAQLADPLGKRRIGRRPAARPRRRRSGPSAWPRSGLVGEAHDQLAVLDGQRIRPRPA